MKRKITCSLCVIAAMGCHQPQSKYVIIKYGRDHRWNLYEKYYYSNQIIRSDTCVVFKDLDNTERTICDSFRICEK